MLSQLTIRNFAIVDHLQIDWHPGLNVITGETGAGKSILIDAVGALLGDRLGPEIVRSGATRALVEGVFIIADAEPRADLKAVLDEYGLEPEDGALIVSREIAGSGGRGGARINGRGVPLSVIQELGELLVDVHGQSEHLSLLKTREHINLLDSYANLEGQRNSVAAVVHKLAKVRAEIDNLVQDEAALARRIDMLGSGHRALPDEGAVPGAPMDAQDGPALVPPLVPGIEVVTVGQGDGRRADEVVVQAEHGAGGVAEHAVDAHAELLVGLDLLGSLEVFAF